LYNCSFYSEPYNIIACITYNP